MGFILPALPTPKAYKVELADFWEIEAIKQSNRPISSLDIAKILSVGSDELDHDGIDSEDDAISSKLEEVFNEFSRRQKAATDVRYPFEVKSTSIQLKSGDELIKYVYLFLLLSTRFNMNTNKVHGGKDGTKVFEYLCSEVAANYFGENSKSLVFGTSVTGAFQDKVENLVSELNEGAGFKNRNRTNPKKNDDSVDIVVWKEFADEEPGKLIGFGQCKTGTSWVDTYGKLKPGNFCNSWLLDKPILEPIPIIFIADIFNFELNFPELQRDYLFFSRFRIMQYLPEELDENLEGDIRTWVDAALGEFR